MSYALAVTWLTCYSSTVIHDLNACDEKDLVHREGFKQAEDLLTHYEVIFMSVKHIQVHCSFE
jgi:hypothetical protein